MPRGLTLLTIRHADGAEALGVKLPGGVLDVRAAARALGLPVPLTLDALLQEGRAPELDALVAAATAAKLPLLDESTLTHGRLLARPGKIVCVGLNYMKHAVESGMAPPRVPPLFNKYNNALTGHGAVVALPPRDVAYKIDYETELLVVMGRDARNVSAASALDYVAGYAVGHDLSARDLQLELPAVQWMIGKTLDGFAPVGPYFVGADVVGDPNALRLTTRVNGVRVQDDNTSDLIHSVQDVIAYVSRHWTLQAGDIIFTGTPSGVIHGLPKARQVWLKAGDVVESTVDKLGTLRFTLA